MLLKISTTQRRPRSFQLHYPSRTTTSARLIKTSKEHQYLSFLKIRDYIKNYGFRYLKFPMSIKSFQSLTVSFFIHLLNNYNIRKQYF